MRNAFLLSDAVIRPSRILIAVALVCLVSAAGMAEDPPAPLNKAKIGLVLEGAEKNVVLEEQKIVNINQTSDRFWQRFNGSINSGLMYSKANQSTQYTFDTQVNYPRPRWGAGASFASTLSGNTGAATSTYNDASLYYRRLLRWNNWFYTGLGSFLQSSEQKAAIVQGRVVVGGSGSTGVS